MGRLGSGAVGVLGVSAALLYGEGIAAANGRFPKAQVVVLPGGDEGRTLYLRATFGILTSKDGGRSFRWVCEQALGFDGTYDPPIAVLPDGRLFAGSTDGMRVRRDPCTFDDVPALRGEQVTDLTVDRERGRVFVTTSTPGKPAFVFRSDAAGVFTRVSKGVAGVAFDTIEVARSKPSRVYVTGGPADGSSKGVQAHLYRSDDGGATLTEMKPTLPKDGRLFVSAIDPRNADRVLVRQLDFRRSDVLLSEDGGKTFRSVFHINGGLLGFAMSDDGQYVYVGSGLAVEGLWRSKDRGATWEQAAHVPVHCLTTDGPRLYICGPPYQKDGFALAVSTDHGTTVQPLATFEDVTGPIACDAGSAAACESAWPPVKAVLAATAAAMVAPAPSAVSPAMAASSEALVNDGGATSERRKGACACGLVGRENSRSAPLGALSGLLATLLLRRRKRLLDPSKPGGSRRRPSKT